MTSDGILYTRSIYTNGKSSFYVVVLLLLVVVVVLLLLRQQFILGGINPFHSNCSNPLLQDKITRFCDICRNIKFTSFKIMPTKKKIANIYRLDLQHCSIVERLFGDETVANLMKYQTLQLILCHQHQ